MPQPIKRLFPVIFRTLRGDAARIHPGWVKGCFLVVCFLLFVIAAWAWRFLLDTIFCAQRKDPFP
jgi:hypothetical protein